MYYVIVVYIVILVHVVIVVHVRLQDVQDVQDVQETYMPNMYMLKKYTVRYIPQAILDGLETCTNVIQGYGDPGYSEKTAKKQRTLTKEFITFSRVFECKTAEKSIEKLFLVAIMPTIINSYHNHEIEKCQKSLKNRVSSMNNDLILALEKSRLYKVINNLHPKTAKKACSKSMDRFNRIDPTSGFARGFTS